MSSGEVRAFQEWEQEITGNSYGVITDEDGHPIAVSVYPGNTGDASTVSEQTEKLRERFGLNRMVLVGDRGTLTQTQLDKMKEGEGIGWITALRSESIRRLVNEGSLQRSLFDEKNLAEIVSDEYPGERLVACFNQLSYHLRRARNDKSKHGFIELVQKAAPCNLWVDKME